MKPLKKVLAFLAALAIMLTATAWVLDMAFTADYISARSEQGGAFAKLAEGLPEFASTGAGPTARQQTEVMEAVLTPGYVGSKLTGYLEQLEERYRYDGPAPLLDLSDLGQLAAREGFQMQGEPIILAGDPLPVQGARSFFAGLENTKTVALGAAVALLLMLAMVGGTRHFLSRPAGAFLGGGIGIAGMGLMLTVIAGPLTSTLTADPKVKPLEPAIESTLEAFLSGVALWMWQVAAGLTVLAVVLYVFQLILNRRREKREKVPKRRRREEEGGLITSD